MRKGSGLLLLTTVLTHVAATSATPLRLPREADLRPRYRLLGLAPGAQGKRGTCSVFAVVGVLEYELAQAGQKPSVRLSVEYLNWASHQTNDRRTDGSFFSDALNGIAKYGVCRDELLPYASAFDPDLAPPDAARQDARNYRSVTARWIKEWDVKTGLTDAQMDAIRQSLAEGHPVAAGMRWPRQARFDARHRMNLPPPEEVFDGHSVVLVGYEDDPDAPGGGTFLFRNASGPDWQDGGHARLSYAYARAYINDAVGLRIGK